MTTALVAGGAGMLGSQIASHLLDQPDTSVRLLVRPGWSDDPGKATKINSLLDRGATVAIGDVQHPETLDPATTGVDVIISALQGGDDVIVDGQVALARAAVAHGVRRFLPSDFAIDLFHAPAGPPQFAARLRAAAAIEELDLEVIHILNGGFMDQMLNPAFPGLVDVEAGSVSFWGTGTELFDLTTVDDTAAFTARVATDPTAAPGVHAISGARVSFDLIAREVAEVTGVPLRLTPWGDEDQLRQTIAAKGGAGSWAAVMEWYFLALLNTPPLVEVENDRYADVVPVGLRGYLDTAYRTMAKAV